MVVQHIKIELSGNVFQVLTNIEKKLDDMTPAMEKVGHQLTGTIQQNLISQGRPRWSTAPSALAVSEGRETMLRTWAGWDSYNKGKKGNIWKIEKDSAEVGTNIRDEDDGTYYMAFHDGSRFPHAYIFEGDEPSILSTVRQFIERNLK